ncbi:hypothetical protein [Streptomyces phaeochromogenes]|uniref:hypothetical protein n=1 Tax=Streptomyces phaeochromogenes TaxID=1923 RepID=UPI003711D8DD
MSLAAVAIIVSGLSSLFTACNMALTYANYRRTRPKVEVRLHSLGWREREAEETPVVVVTFKNHGQTKAKINTVTATLSRSKKDERTMSGGGPVATEELLLPDVDLAAGIFAGAHAADVPFELEPFNGVQWFAHTRNRDWWRLWGSDGLSELYVTARLSDGTEIHSQRFPLPPGFHGRFSEADESSAGGQLSFDELEEE